MSKIYKMIYRDEENPETHQLHITEAYVRAETRNAAQLALDAASKHRHVVAGPMGPIDEADVPAGATWIN
jgi:hypothetical protein